jgi:hypothetical protein
VNRVTFIRSSSAFFLRMLKVGDHLFTAGAFASQEPGVVPARDLNTAVSAMNGACFGTGQFDAARCAALSADVGRLRMQSACALGVQLAPPPVSVPSDEAILAAVSAPAAARASANIAMLQALSAIGSNPSLAATQLPCGRGNVLTSTAPAYLAAAYPNYGLLAPVPVSPFAPPMLTAAQLFSLGR